MKATQEEFDALVRAYNAAYRELLGMASCEDQNGVTREIARVLGMFEFVLRTHNASRVTFRLPVFPVALSDDVDLALWGLTDEEVSAARSLFAARDKAA
jgi:hypothetical protein